ncbi:MAG: ATPase, T2SS/T4P/T4SS family [Candidatus Woesearchaeota archaeon]
MNKLKQKAKDDARINSAGDVVVPDTSIIVQGLISKAILSNSLKFKRILIPEAVLAELESQANKGRESGYLGLDEITSIRDLAIEKDFAVEFHGSRPGDFEIKFAKSGEIDSLIRDIAQKNNATLLTADVVQGKVALAKGISVIIYDVPNKDLDSLFIEKYFVEGAMSVHLREGFLPRAKVGLPGTWSFVDVGEEILSKDAIDGVASQLIDYAKVCEGCFFESEKKYSVVLQIKNMRVVIVRPPLSDLFEITITRPIANKNLEDYNLSKDLTERLLSKAEGILIAGPPGHGKSTFTQALSTAYLSLSKSIKTLESPRDLIVDESITRFGLAHASQNELRDILLLSRPDFVLFDEVRSFEDFKLFSDLRLSGIGMLGVIHASEPIDSIQRFIGRLDLGLIPHVIDTVIFLFGGVVKKVLSLSLSVKVPSGMVDSDLARPVVLVCDYASGVLEFEIYSYGEQTIVVPITCDMKKKSIYLLAQKQLEDEINLLGVEDVLVEFISDVRCSVFVVKDDVQKLIGDKGRVINGLQKKFGLKIDVFEKRASKSLAIKQKLNFSLNISSKYVVFDLDKNFADVLISIFAGGTFVMSVKSSKKGQIKINRDSPAGKLLFDASNNKDEIKLSLA